MYKGYHRWDTKKQGQLSDTKGRKQQNVEIEQVRSGNVRDQMTESEMLGSKEDSALKGYCLNSLVK